MVTAPDRRSAGGRKTQGGEDESAPPASCAVDLVKTYGSGDTSVRALDGVNVAFAAGRMSAIMGPSGSGKSTLMHCLAGLDDFDSGRVSLGGADITGMGDKDLTALRRQKVGFVFQGFNLVPTLTAEENITLPMDLSGVKPDRKWLTSLIDMFGLADRLSHRPDQLSGGQQQRVACARALASRPAVVFADEPTGNLDTRTSGEVLGLLRRSVDDLGQTVVMVTHDPTSAAFADRAVFLVDGRVVDDMARPTAAKVLTAMKGLGG
jgi:putative ABC transport system ATP-binding protein